ncbi:hypothetical protein EPUL_001147 [Erysiphe pulchra]|uniref:Uncharacterized protein n=1 Tax=Erysiphe pulchra TaxID=225359 RepID=A0A2S4PZE7_9PEZI|nr:hypothetical protein EPUL_001147 [Erysiphe pulchra]
MEYMDTHPTLIELIPSDLWSIPYLSLPGILAAATRINPVRVSEVCAATPSIQSMSVPAISSTNVPLFRATAPAITPYDGQPSTLRAFFSQWVNQINSCHIQFPTELSKVEFAYQSLGSGALVKMRSLFRCLEDPKIPREIKTLTEFLLALKQRCQDPGLCAQAIRTIENLYVTG